MSEITPSISELIEQVSKIPLWKSTNTKCFEIVDDINRGFIPVARLGSWQDFSKLLEHKFFNRPGVEFIFRGHRRFDWELTPTLGRISGTKGSVSTLVASAQYKRFWRAARGRLKNPVGAGDAEENDELWAIGQHFGLMTPLLDWTHSPYVALFFAFHEEDNQGENDNNPYRAIYVLNKSFLCETTQYETRIRLVEPWMDYHGRLVNQAGLFTFPPYESTIETELEHAFALANKKGSDVKDSRNASGEEQSAILARHIYKIYIPNEKQQREICLRHLRRMNVHSASLFPDLLGSSEYCNIITAEEERQAAEATPDPDADRPIELTVDVKETAKLLHDSRFQDSDRIEPMAQELVQLLQKTKIKIKIVDWNSSYINKSKGVRACLFNKMSVILRKYDYRNDSVIHRILDITRLSEEPSA
ncbi:FRG domain-containing protein [Verminephrobacter aporrectodeae subsp. tuberculatae]|uniref:FRG domain-containing protein n=1 Tax=Verminephrobacter aporrectodeae subsp. tuberculatae TaxID=1110392 RepID=A0ABT3KTE5_9BURK|nr:FRG domain-containing protein [Verminephrobacter aporrectodeae]MCW5321597.1 FRG domain-containing protein [Verminephrobacter aporrectodeae subsp. tuberculatae]